MDISFALLLIVCCILGIWAFTATQKNVFYEKQVTELKDKLTDKSQSLNDGPSYSDVLTPELVCQAVRTNGYVPELRDEAVFFMINGETYTIITGRLPIVTVYKGYALTESDYDIPLLREACHRLSDDMIMVKAFVSDEADGINFQLTASEHCYGNFCASLGRYINIIDEAVVRNRMKYDDVVKEKELAAEGGHKQENNVISAANYS